MITNWKTTAIGVGAAILLVAITYAVKHTIDISTLTVAAGLAGVGIASSDAQNDIKILASAAAQLPILQTSVAKNAIGLADTAIGLADAAHPTNVILNDIKAGIDALNQSNTPTPVAKS